MRKNLKNIGLIAAGLATGVFATLQLSASAQQPASAASSAVAPLPLDQLRLFAEVFGQIKHEYVEPVDDKKLLTAAIKGMVSSSTRTRRISTRPITKNCRSRPRVASRVSASKFRPKTA